MPSSTFRVDIEGIDQLIEKFRAGERQALVEMVTAMQETVSLTKKDAQVYPPESDANQPPPPYYIRGRGTQYPDGTNRFESQHLNETWTTNVDIRSREVVGTVANLLTTYAAWVHGVSVQAWFHRMRGWRNVRQIADDVLPRVKYAWQKAGERLARFFP